MTPLHAWSQRWGLPPACLQELLAIMGVTAGAPPPPATGQPGSEAGLQARRVLRAARLGNWLLRNNSGSLMDKRGVPVRFGLGNVSPQVNRIMKSSDLIGIERVLVTSQMVGQVVGVFSAEEIKDPGWVYLGDRQCVCKPQGRQCDYCHQKAQMNFIKKVLSLGGIARFVTSEEQP